MLPLWLVVGAGGVTRSDVLIPERCIDNDVLNFACSERTPDTALLNQVAERIAVDEINRRNAVARRLHLGIACKGTCRDDHALPAAPTIAPRKSRTAEMIRRHRRTACIENRSASSVGPV